MIKCGHPAEDVHYLVNRGLYSQDKFLIFEELNILREARNEK